MWVYFFYVRLDILYALTHFLYAFCHHFCAFSPFMRPLNPLFCAHSHRLCVHSTFLRIFSSFLRLFTHPTPFSRPHAHTPKENPSAFAEGFSTFHYALCMFIGLFLSRFQTNCKAINATKAPRPTASVQRVGLISIIPVATARIRSTQCKLRNQ